MDAYLGSLSSFALAYTCNSARHALYNCYDKERYRLDLESHAALIVLLTINVSVYEGLEGNSLLVGFVLPTYIELTEVLARIFCF